jgi:DNA topoisomerase-3
MQKLLATGKTDLLKGFISNKTRRKFSAYLVRDPATGKVGFEFEPRAPRAGAKPSAKAAEAKPAKAASGVKAAVGAGDAAPKPVVKKAAAKKPPTKKPAAKKAVAKPAVKKATAKKA